MKSTETYSEIRNIVEPWCKLNGFKRMRTGVPAWCKPVGEKTLIFWFQVERYGWSTNLGSSFYVEFQLSESSKIGSWGHQTTRKRLRHFLTDDEFINFRRFRDKVVVSLTPLPADWPDSNTANVVAMVSHISMKKQNAPLFQVVELLDICNRFGGNFRSDK